MAEEKIVPDWKERAEDLQELKQDIAKGKRHYQLFADMEPDLVTRVVETYNALGDLEGTKAAMERANGAMAAENQKLDDALTKKRASTQQETATLGRTLKAAQQANAVAVTESNTARNVALQTDQDAIEASRQEVVQTLAGHAGQKQEADVAHALMLQGYAEAEAEAKLATAEAEKLRAQLTALGR